ncbi:transposase, partial [Sphingomonas sp. PAMC 26605]|uniref:transposase n=1 Tax=Sphingomonas sp. PAMC 26605 TaxID=1112214 RepID=UPI00026CD824
MGQVTVISGAERRRLWSDEQKLALIEAAFAPGAKVARVAARADLWPSQIYRWRRDLLGSQSM